MIKLANNTIDQKDLNSLCEWIQTNPRLTKGEKTIEFEEKWSKWLGTKYSVYVNSGSSANLAMVYTLNLGKKKNNKIVVPAVSWVTTVAPVIQFGFEPIICDVDLDTLGLDLNCLEYIFKKHKPFVLIGVHALGFPCKINEILNLCRKYNVKFLEDSCETVGSTYNKIKTGNFGLMSSFSFYFGHHVSTIEGGMVCTNDKKIYDILKMIRSHGWGRDLDEPTHNLLKKKYSVSDFKSLYTFYYPGFNIRATDLQAYIGIRQLDKLDFICNQRFENFKMYQEKIKNTFWKIKPKENEIVSNFAYPIIHKNINKIISSLITNNIETRPLICGSISKQPFIKKYKVISYSDKADKIVDKYGIYLPNNHELTAEQIVFISNVVNNSI